jgi:uncharacterized protein
MNSRFPMLPFTLAALSGLVLTGCLNLKPQADPTRYFILTPMAPPEPPNPRSAGGLALGIGPVEVPDYLNNNSIAVRKDGAEIEYLVYRLWAERPEKGLLRIVSANLGGLLHTESILLNDWRREDVARELHIRIQRFDFDEHGSITLDAVWRTTRPGGGETIRTGHTVITKQGPPPEADTAGAVSQLSEALADFSRELAAALSATGS